LTINSKRDPTGTILWVFPLISVLAGCGLSTSQVYLHSADTQKSTQQAKDDFGKIKVDQYFSDQKKEFADFAKQEDTAVSDYLVAARDRQLTLLLRRDQVSQVFAPPKDFDAPRTTLESTIKARLKRVIGGGEYDDQQLDDLRHAPQLFHTYRATTYGFADTAEHDRQEYLKLRLITDVRPTDCSKIDLGLGANRAWCDKLSTPVTAEDFYDQLKCDCDDIKSRGQTPEYLAASKEMYSATSGDLGDVDSAINAINQQISDDNQKAAEIQRAIKDLSQAPEKTTQQELQSQHDSLRNELNGASGAAKFMGAKEISAILEQILAADLSSAAQSSGSESTGSASSSPAPGGTDSGGTPAKAPESPITRGAIAVLQTTKALAGISDAFATQPRINRINSVLIALAEQHQYMDMAKLDIDYQNNRFAILSAEREALILEVGELATAERLLRSLPNSRVDGFAELMNQAPAARKETIGATLSAYETSWNQGQIPFKVMQFQEVQLERAYITTVHQPAHARSQTPIDIVSWRPPHITISCVYRGKPVSPPCELLKTSSGGYVNAIFQGPDGAPTIGIVIRAEYTSSTL
jgi:hypothetical protein